MQVELSFLVHGYIKQTVEITRPRLSKKKLIKMLNQGVVLTTIQEGGNLILNSVGDEVIVGKVVNVDNNLEYEEFELCQK